MHDAFFARSALRLRHRLPAQSSKAAFLLNSLLTPLPPPPQQRQHPPAAEYTLAPTSGGARAPRFARIDAGRSTSVDTATETLRALRAHGLLPVLVRELTEPTPYGPDGDEGDGCDADLEEKLIRCVSRSNYVCI
ncbi:hypothetical protein BJV77DRAFT_163980 [Russula vinacea]|nr:hypothetical protein BJV77DRAFT_163980 [Russula vinacea]